MLGPDSCHQGFKVDADFCTEAVWLRKQGSDRRANPVCLGVGIQKKKKHTEKKKIPNNVLVPKINHLH